MGRHNQYLFRGWSSRPIQTSNKQTKTRTNEMMLKTISKIIRGDEPERQGETPRTMRPSSGGHTASEPIRSMVTKSAEMICAPVVQEKNTNTAAVQDNSRQARKQKC